MTKSELFEKYKINETHSVWNNNIDNWISVEVYRIMHGGELPKQDDLSVKWICDFLDKKENDFQWWVDVVMTRKDWGSLYLTAKRMIYSHCEQILEELNI